MPEEPASDSSVFVESVEKMYKMNVGNFAKMLGTDANPEQCLFTKVLPCLL